MLQIIAAVMLSLTMATTPQPATSRPGYPWCNTVEPVT